MDQAMKTTIRIACTLAAFSLAGPAALARDASAQATTAAAPTQTAAQTAEQREKARLEAEAAKKAAAERANVERARQDIERAQQQVEQAQKTAEKRAQQEVTREVEKVQEALKEAQRELELYAKGTAALDTARYEKALQAFAEAAALKGAKADSSLYWKAFAEYKVQALQAALESLKEIQKNFPDSRWLEQALALELEVKGAMGKPVSPAATPDEEL
jgi:colicin import membrane protein